MTSFVPQALLLTLLLALLGACDGPIDLVDPFDRIQGEPSGQSETLLDIPANEPEPSVVGLESGGAGGEAHMDEVAPAAEEGH